MPCWRTTAIVALAMLTASSDLQAQGSLIKRNRLSGTPALERITFSGTTPLDGDTGPGIKSIQQIAVPLGATFSLGSRITLDVGAAYTSGTVEYSNGSEVSIDGLSDVRVRATSKLVGDGLVLSLGANLPLGTTSLDDDQLAAVRVLAAPAFGLQLPAIGFGPAGSVGLVGTRPVGEWIGALGVSYEYRGKFSPIAALQAGAEPDFDPGNSTHVTAGLEGFVGEARLTLQASADFFSDDVLSQGGRTTQAIKLGPVFTIQSALMLGGGVIRDGRIHGALRRRSTFSRDGATVDGGDGIYLSGGAEGGIPLGQSLDLHVAGDLLSQSGLDIDNTLMTAKASSATVLLGLRVRGSGATFEPFVRAGRGSVDPGRGSASFSSLSAGVSLVLRF